MGYGTVLRVNRVAIKDPIDYQVSISDIDASATRNAYGDLTRDRVATKYKVESTWNALHPDEMAELLQAVRDEFFTVEFYNPYEGTFSEKVMYVGDRTAPLGFAKEDGTYVWQGLSMNFIER